MENNNAPFNSEDKVIALEDSTVCFEIKKDMIFTVKDCRKTSCCNRWFVCVGIKSKPAPGICLKCMSRQFEPTGFLYHNHFIFAKINPYSNSVSKSLAEQACKEVIEIDNPVKEIVNN